MRIHQKNPAIWSLIKVAFGSTIYVKYFTVLEVHMKITKLLAVLMALITAVGSFTTAAFAAPNATVDMNATHQTMDGWGASYTWYADWLTNNVNAEQAYDWIFNDTEFNILRFRDLNQVNGDEALNAVNGYPAYKAYYDAAVARGITPTVLVTSWGQYDRNLPWVSYTENSANGFSYFTLAKDENGEYMYDALADYVVESVKLFWDAGIPVHYYSISNEIELQERHVDENGNRRDDAGFFLGQEENEDHCAYWKAHIAVYDALHEAYGDFAPELLGAECMAAYDDLLKGYLDPLIEARPETVSTVGHHLYGYEQTVPNFIKTRAAYPDYTFWQTEWYTDEHIKLADHIINALNYEDVNAWLFWNGAWAPDQGITLVEIAGAGEQDEVKRGNNHYIMMHFSKFIKEGYIRIDINEELKSNMTAFKSPDGKKLVVVGVNTTNESEFLELDVGEEILGSAVYQTLGNENRFRFKNWNELGEYKPNMELPGLSVTTLVFDLAGDPNYVAPAPVEEVVNPFIKQPSTVNVPLVAGIAGGAAVLVVIVVVIVVLASKKKAKPEPEAAE